MLDKIEMYSELYLIPFGINLLSAIAVFVVGRMVARFIIKTIRKLADRANVDPSLSKFLSDVAYGVLMTVIVIASLERLGVKTTAAIAVLGAMGLAIGLALQSSLGNFAAGVMLIVLKPYKIGDVVNIAGQVGTVEGVKIFQTVLRTGDNRIISIPNGNITNGVIENITAEPTRRIDLVIGVGYSDDLKKTHEILRQAVEASADLLAEPAPTIAVSELAASSVNFVVRPWVKTENYWTARFALIEEIKHRLDAAGISIPFPQHDVHMIPQSKAA